MANYTDNTLKPGSRLKSSKREYIIEEVLGQGGFGITYKASWQTVVENVPVKIPFAIKEFFMSDSCERHGGNNSQIVYSNPVKDKVEEARSDFLAEARRLNSLQHQHPCIVKVNEVFEANNTAYYVMEYLDGSSLRRLIHKSGPLAEQEALGYILPLAQGVQSLHDSLITHLDIKPDNVMMKRDLQDDSMLPVLIDFGLSKHYDAAGNATSTVRAGGISAGYAPVEQYTGITTFTPEADVYALAATLFFMLTGHDPAIATELTQEKIEAALPASVTPQTRSAIKDAMRTFKHERTQSVNEFISNLSGGSVETKRQEKAGGSDQNEQDDPNKTVVRKKSKNGSEPAVTPPYETNNSGGGSGDGDDGTDTVNIHGEDGSRQQNKDKKNKKKKKRVWTLFLLGVFAIATMLFIGLRTLNQEEETDNGRQEYISEWRIGDFIYTGDAIVYNDTTIAPVPSGNGTAVYENGDEYTGAFEDGRRSGEGTLRYANGDLFEGTFRHDNPYRGKFTPATGDEYFEGTMDGDKPMEGVWYYKYNNELSRRIGTDYSRQAPEQTVDESVYSLDTDTAAIVADSVAYY